MRTLRKRPRPDTHKNELRRKPGRLGRFIYMGMLIAVFAVIANYLWGDLLVFQADGLVVREKTVIAASSLSQIKSVAVAEGQEVAAGTMVLRIESTEILERLADLSMRGAELTQRQAALTLQADAARKMLPLAVKRETEADTILGRLEGAQSANLVVSSRYFDALDASYDARSERVRLQTEAQGFGHEQQTLAAAAKDARKALADLRSHYADGVITAPVSGTVGDKPPAPGTVFRAGDPMLTLFSGSPYVLAYLPERYLFAVPVGQRVTVTAGRMHDTGTISAILPLTDALPQEFQAGFRPRTRSQLARVTLDHPDRFPLFAKVRINTEELFSF